MWRLEKKIIALKKWVKKALPIGESDAATEGRK